MRNRIRLKILEKRMEAPDVASLVLQPTDNYFSYKPGQFLTLLLQFQGREIRRSYSLSSSPGVDPYPTITVKRKPNGQASSYLVENARPGDEITALPPAGQFVLPVPQNHPHYLFMVAGGSGITPVFSIIKYALACTPRFQAVLVYANRDEKTLIFREELSHWLHLYPERFRAVLLLSNPGGDLSAIAEASRAQVVSGRLGNALLEELLQKNLPADASAVDFYLCGPPGLMLKSENALRFLGHPESRIHKEVFTVTPPFRPPAAHFPAGKAVLAVNGSESSFPVRAGQSVLEAAEEAGLDLPYSCRSGICTTCTARCLEGEVVMYLPEGPVSSQSTQGVIQTCVGYPATRKVRITLS
ncbi:MAG: ferredoxin--NADP reductase [Phaeodactylibacter sp.]|nr:ferredoxin--NADP reductase [Phaeodactylibacter sp.]